MLLNDSSKRKLRLVTRNMDIGEIHRDHCRVLHSRLMGSFQQSQETKDGFIDTDQTSRQYDLMDEYY